MIETLNFDYFKFIKKQRLICECKKPVHWWWGYSNCPYCYVTLCVGCITDDSHFIDGGCKHHT